MISYDTLSSRGLFWGIVSPIIYALICLRVNRAKLQDVMGAAFIVGFLTSYIAYTTEVFLGSQGMRIGADHQWFGLLAFVALPEECVKLAALIGLARVSVRAASAGLVVACFIGGGFAASENLVYLQRFGADVIATRFLTATAFHVFNAIVMARLFRSANVADENHRIIAALSVAVLLHATYDYLIGQFRQDGGLFVFVLALTVAAGLTTLRTYPSTEG